MKKLMPLMAVLAGCATTMTETDMASHLEYMDEGQRVFIVSTVPIDKSYQSIGVSTKVDPFFYASVIRHKDAHYNLYLTFEYTAYNAVPFGAIKLGSHTYYPERVTSPQVDSCSSSGRCIFYDFYKVALEEETMNEIADSLENYPITIQLGSQQLHGVLPSAEARVLRRRVFQSL